MSQEICYDLEAYKARSGSAAAGEQEGTNSSSDPKTVQSSGSRNREGE